jgi:uncharacterized protein (DUF1015 family)
MADVRPFRGLRFDPARVNVSTVLCPPFDVISPAEQEAYHAQDARNFCRLQLGQGNSLPAAPDPGSRRAAQTLESWLAEGVLAQDDQPGIYLYEHRFTAGGEERVRHGLLVAGRLHDWTEGVILPHEHIRKGPIESRLALLRAANTNVSPLWLVYADPVREIASLLAHAWEQPPLADAETRGERHILRAVRDPRALHALSAAFADRRLYVADGHHRYHTALLYRDEQRQRAAQRGSAADSNAGYEFALMLLVALDDPGMLLLPTHRLVRGLDATPAELRKNLSRWFTLTPFDVPADDDAAGSAIERKLAEEDRHGHIFALLDNEGAWLLRPRDDVDWQAQLPQEQSDAWRGLDVVVLDTLAIRDVCGIRAEAEAAHADATSHGAADRLTYVSDWAGAVRAVRQGEAEQAFLLNPTRLEQVCAVADAGDKMPPKSTFFVPKPMTGMVMHRLDGER